MVVKVYTKKFAFVVIILSAQLLLKDKPLTPDNRLVCTRF